MPRLIVVSNRTPSKAPAAGGLAVALKTALSSRQGCWFGWSGEHASRPEPTARFQTIDGIEIGGVDLSRDDFNAYYTGYANSILWPAFHLRLDLANFEPSWYEGYRRVNARFAAAIFEHLRPDDVVWVHDYHFIPLATELRRLGAGNRIGFYLHIPFPTPDALFAIPHSDALLEDLSSYDLVGLQAKRDVAALHEAIDHAAPPTFGNSTRTPPDFSSTAIMACPIGSDPQAFARLATSTAANKMANRVTRTLRDMRLILGVDRLDYSKGLPQRVEAYEKLLDYNAGLRRRVHMMQIAPPSRDMISEYRDTSDALDSICGRVMGRFSEPDWQPLTYLKRPYGQASLAGIYRLARVGLVTPLRDGMNLVAHEYIACQDPEDPGVLVLSRFAGAAEIFPDAVQVNPFDTDETADALRVALAMPLAERKERWQSLMSAARTYDIHHWSEAFLGSLVPPKRPKGRRKSGESYLRELYADLRTVRRNGDDPLLPPAE
jgi:trehalose 6-phosphate synthase